MTIEELINSREDLRPGTKREYLRAFREFKDFAGHDPRTWTRDVAQAWKYRLQAIRIGDPPRAMSGRTINIKINAIRTASRLWFVHNNSRHEFNFGDQLQQIRELDPPKKKQALNYEQAQSMIDACAGGRPIDLRDRAMTVLGFKTGMRRMSLAALEFEQIDWNTNTMAIKLKGGKVHRMPPLDRETFAALEPWRDWLRSHGVRSGRFFRGMYGLPSLGSAGGVRESITVDGIHKVLVGRAKTAGLDGFSPHTFRHTFVTWMQFHEHPGYLIRAYTGHSTDAMVLEYTDAWIAARKRSPMADFQLRV